MAPYRLESEHQFAIAWLPYTYFEGIDRQNLVELAVEENSYNRNLVLAFYFQRVLLHLHIEGGRQIQTSYHSGEEMRTGVKALNGGSYTKENENQGHHTPEKIERRARRRADDWRRHQIPRDCIPQ